MFFGIVCLAITGLCWVAVGVVISHASRKKINLGMIQFLNAATGATVSLAIVLTLSEWAAVSAETLWRTGAMFVGAGITNFLALQMMGRAMKRGPNGAVWTVMQSALVFPFLLGILFFDVESSLGRWLGLAAIIGGIVCIGLGKSGHSAAHATGNWRWPALAAFLLAGVNQCLSNLPSYWSDAAAVGSVSRTLFTQVGIIGGWVAVGHFRKSATGQWRAVSVMALGLTALGLFSSYIFFYRGLNLVAEAGAGAIGYPVVIGSCMIGFFLYSLLVLRERPALIQWIGNGLGLAGMVMICL